jgi:hypothetical protein
MTYGFSVDLEAQLEPDLWRGLVRLRADNSCEDCGVVCTAERRLHAHHINGNHDDNRLANGEGLCKPCHHRRHVSAMHTPESAAKISATQTGRKSARWARLTEEQRRDHLARMQEGRRHNRKANV